MILLPSITLKLEDKQREKMMINSNTLSYFRLVHNRRLDASKTKRTLPVSDSTHHIL